MHKNNGMRLVKHLGLALIAASVVSSCNDNSVNEQKNNRVTPSPQQEQIQQQEQVQTPGQLNTPSTGEADQYGRLPGDAHYGHDHPPQDQNIQPGSPAIQQQTTPAGGPDKYGREPGHAHYGHDHPIQDNEQSTQPLQTSPIRVP